ncbi:phage terminase large subunit [Bacillus sp. JJ1503]|uniref:phage terminase large subunit n=1 Tax=Bacillus sp. JJ1503 TaxID=3122956 RepID=UPI00300060BE
MGANVASLDDVDLAKLDGYITELERLRRVHRAEVDLLYFAWCYFSDVANPDNDGNWDGFDLPSVDFAPRFHKEICDIIDDVAIRTPNAKVAVAAPRSHAKSSYLSKASPLREIVMRRRKYIIIISETPSVATANLEWIANQLKGNAKLRADFGPLLSPKQQMNPRDNSSEFIAWESQGEVVAPKQLTLTQAASTGQALRGRNWNGTRPDLVICDDLEDLRSNAGTKEQREKLADWFSAVVMPLGDPKGKKTAFQYMGTVVHAESLLNNVIKHRADFNSVKYKALIDEPDRMDLWERCRALYLDDALTPTERKEAAEQFYADNYEEMERGAVVLWPEVQPLWKLMTWKWDNGSKAFNTEYQNEPRDEESAIFHVDKLRMFDESDLFDKEGRPMPLEFFGFWDIAFGKSRRSDYNAIVTVARNRITGVLFVVDAWAKKCQAHEALEVAVEKIEEYGHKIFGVETVGAQHDLYRQLRERLAKDGIYGTKLKPIVTRSNKEERIESLEPLCESGFLRFRKDQRLLFEQLEQFPGGTHDDLPDSLAGAVDLAGGTRRRRTFYTKPKGV